MSISDEQSGAMDSLPEDALSLLDAIRTPVSIAPQALSRMEHRLALAVAVSAGAAGVASKGVVSVVATKLALFFSRKIPLSLSALAVGIGIGAGAHAVASRETGQKSEAPVVILTQSTRTESVPLPVATDRTPTVEAHDLPSVPVAVPKNPEPHLTTTETTPSMLAEERALVEMARTALARGDNAAALAAAQDHERAFASGRLREEREFIAVKALAALGRSKEAEARGTRFLTSYPRSMFAPAVRASVSIPVKE